MRSIKLWRQPGEQCFRPRDDIGFHHNVDNRLYGPGDSSRLESRGGANVVVIGYDVADGFSLPKPDR